jgi:hypothetical protein
MMSHPPDRPVLPAPCRFSALRIPSLALAVGLVMLAACAASEKPARGPYRVEPTVSICFCPSNHSNVVYSTKKQWQTMLDSAPCTSRGDGAEERAEEWSRSCREAVSRSGLDFDTEAVVYMNRFFSSGSITGSLHISGPEDGVLTVEIRSHMPPPPWTPNLGFFSVALVIDKTQVKQIKTYDINGSEVVLAVE